MPTTLPNGWGACSVAVGDLTGDGKADVVALGCVTSGPGPIFVLKAAGGATLTLVQTLPNTANGQIGIADLANDGQPDLVFSATGSADVRVYKGVSSGTFSAPTAAPAATDSHHIAIGDVTGDGRPDLVGAAGGPVWVMPATAAGGLGPQVVTFSSQLQAYNLALGQFDTDGRLDVATVDASGGNLFIGLGTGDGHFVPKTSFAGVSSQSLWAATGDSRPDLISQTRGQVAVRPGLGGTAFGAPLLSGLGASGQIETLVGDVTGDAVLDVVAVLRTGGPDVGAGEVAVNRGAGNGTFTLSQTVIYDSNTRGGVLADLTGDGRLDVAVVGSAGSDGGRNGLYVMLNVNGSLSSPTYYPRGVSGITVGDFKPGRRARPDLGRHYRRDRAEPQRRCRPVRPGRCPPGLRKRGVLRRSHRRRPNRHRGRQRRRHQPDAVAAGGSCDGGSFTVSWVSLVLGGGGQSIGRYAAGLAVAHGASVVDYVDDCDARLEIAAAFGATTLVPLL